ncbi:MAG: hypothetical protein H6Q27_253 [Ignavibacteriaceae bacterium]|nr:hypothetical protein [Ignavibacteriaceae bacterium]
MSFSSKAIKYFCNLETPKINSSGVKIVNPYKRVEVNQAVKKFYTKFYSDENDRLFMIGINPGRFGGGLTGIAFTDPVALREYCKIENKFGNRKELSSKFIYAVIEKYGGNDKFFSKVFLSALYPFAIVKDGKNYNYYDEKILAENLRPDIIWNIKKQIDFGARRDLAIILGKKNADCFISINDECGFFKKIISLEHPRYIMQYRLKKADKYIDKYISAII